MRTIHAFKNLWVPMLLIVFSQLAFAQTDKELLAQLAEENQTAVNALVLYPEETRQSILETTLYPEALIKLESVQQTTSASFKNLVEQYPQEVQELIWDLTRYPELIPNLVQLGSDNRSDVDLLLKNYPEIIHSRVWNAYNHHYPLLTAISDLQQSADRAFEALLANYPPTAQEAFRELIDLPEVLTLLTENIRLSILVGDLYRSDPEWIMHKTDSLSREVTRQNARELQDWKQSLEDDPAARDELEASAKEFAEANAYDDLYYDADGSSEDPDVDRTRVVEYHYYHYPFWFGYPYWYNYPRWRPYPLWYDWGFYFYPDRRITVIYLPSYYFIHWYFDYPRHHYRHPRLSAHFIRYYHRHPRANNSICNNVHIWRESNKKVISDDFLKPDKDLVNRVKEYGKFENDRVVYNQKNQTNTKSPTEFLEQNRRKYPTLEKTVPKTKPEVVNKRPTAVTPKPQTTKPRTVTPPKSEAPKTTPVPTRKQPKPKVDEGRKYHENTWEKSQKKQVPRVRTTPRKTETKTTRPSTVKKQRTSPAKTDKKNR